MTTLILTHPNADFDALASLVGAHKLHPDYLPVLSVRQKSNVRDFLAIYGARLAPVRKAGLSEIEVERVLLVDTQRLPDFRGLARTTPFAVLDHHPRQPETPDAPDIIIDETGANATLLIERMQAADLRLTELEATVLALGIYEDTGSLTYGTTTARDARAAAWVLAQGADLDTVRRYLSPPLTREQQHIFRQLLAAAETRTVRGFPVTVAAVTLPAFTAELAAIAHRLRETLEPAALFMVVQMPDYVQLICRSTDDALDVGEIAGLFDGGGHDRAAAAAIRDLAAEAVVARLWEAVHTRIRPLETVGDLMSHGVQTVQAGEAIGSLISRLRRVGHEGYPVLDDGQLIGLLTLRDADRALEHGLAPTPVRELMKAGNVTLTPDDSINTLEQLIVRSGWGQIPVVRDGQLIGIVTRTDLINYRARTQPAPPAATPTLAPAPPAVMVTDDQMLAVLGEAAARLIQTVAQQAQTHGISLYLVGGVVRDLLLQRPNLDIDFVVETDAIGFARDLSAAYGGEVIAHQAFGTAKWRPEATGTAHPGTDLAALPTHLDFATARNEFYEHPTALPTVYAGSIKLDLQRRDFTINTLAVQLSPAQAAGRVLDPYHGLADLHAGLIRVLHSLSFVDDPTRILRAVRFAQRLKFTIEPRTADLIAPAQPMLRRITGERLRNELTLLLREAAPENGLLALENYGALVAIHPALHFDPAAADDFRRTRQAVGLADDYTPRNGSTAIRFPFPDAPPVSTADGADIALTDLYWHQWLARFLPPEVEAITGRLLMGKSEATSIRAATDLLRHPAALADERTRPGKITARLDGVPEIALLTAWLLTDQPVIRERIARYLTEWRHIHAVTTGHTLKARGLPPGPRYRQLLDRLRTARLDGEVTDDAGEAALLEQLLRESDDT